MAVIEELLIKVKQNLILEHSVDDELLKQFITAAISYAESYQHIEEGYYQKNKINPKFRIKNFLMHSNRNNTNYQ